MILVRKEVLIKDGSVSTTSMDFWWLFVSPYLSARLGPWWGVKQKTTHCQHLLSLGTAPTFYSKSRAPKKVKNKSRPISNGKQEQHLWPLGDDFVPKPCKSAWTEGKALLFTRPSPRRRHIKGPFNSFLKIQHDSTYLTRSSRSSLIQELAIRWHLQVLCPNEPSVEVGSIFLTAMKPWWQKPKLM